MATIDFESMRKQMRAEAAARRAAQKAAAADQGAAPPPIAAAVSQLGEPEPEPELELPAAGQLSVANDPLRAPFGALAVVDRWHRAVASNGGEGDWSIPLHVLVREPPADEALREGRSMALAQLASFDVGLQAGLPRGGVHYIPSFVSEEEERRLLHVLYCPAAQPRWLGRGGKHGRRTQNWGGRPGALAVAEPLPPFCRALIDALVSCGVFEPELAPNHVLVNECVVAALHDTHAEEGVLPCIYPHLLSC